MFGVSAAILAVGLLLIALTVVVLSLLRSLVTGRKPHPAMAFARFRQFSQQRTWPGGSTFRGRSAAASDQIVDVEAHEIKGSHRQP